MWHHVVYLKTIRKEKQDDSEHSEDGEGVFRVKETKDLAVWFRVNRKGNRFVVFATGINWVLERRGKAKVFSSHVTWCEVEVQVGLKFPHAGVAHYLAVCHHNERSGVSTCNGLVVTQSS